MATSDVEIPSDLHGIVYVSLDDLDEWSWALVREFLEAGISFDARTMSHACSDLFTLR